MTPEKLGKGESNFKGGPMKRRSLDGFAVLFLAFALRLIYIF
jgi:hypothetical protein